MGPARTIDLGLTFAQMAAAKFPLETDRMRKVVETVAEKSGWASKEVGSRSRLRLRGALELPVIYCAVAEVKIDEQGKPTIPRVPLEDYTIHG
jgi:hypothetical protein